MERERIELCPECAESAMAVKEIHNPQFCRCTQPPDNEVIDECWKATSNLFSEAVSEDESEAERTAASPTTSDEDFIVSDSEMEEVDTEDAVEDQIELLFESFVNLQEEHKILKKELQKQSCLLFEIHQELKANTTSAK